MELIFSVCRTNKLVLEAFFLLRGKVWLRPCWFPTAEKNPDSWLVLLTSLSAKLFPLTTVEMLLVRLRWRLLLLDLEEVVGCDTTRLTLVGLDPPLAELVPELQG